jgi:hypothetical protein
MACELGAGLAVLHQASGTFYILGEIETFIWNRLSRPATSEQIELAISETYDATPDQIKEDVRTFLASMIGADLLESDAVCCP